MSKVIKYVAVIDELTKQLISVEFPMATLPPEGLKPTGERVIHISEDNIPSGFMEDNFNTVEWVYDSGSLIHLGTPPNRHAIYNGTDWEWDADAFMSDIKTIRNHMIAATDWTQTVDAPLTDEQVAEYRVYRQSLRDFPATLDNPSSLDELEWPVKP
jgi:hypothetical protein